MVNLIKVRKCLEKIVVFLLIANINLLNTGLIKGTFSPPSPESIQELKNLYCCNIPSDLMNRDLLRDHFSQFGQVLRLYLSYKRNSCSVHFKTHVSMFSYTNACFISSVLFGF